MKRIFIYFSPLILMLVAGCLKPDNSDPVYAPTGKFVGQFTRLHYSATKKNYDTIKANLTIIIDVNSGYAVSGDTTYHSTSYGDFYIDANNISFYDKNHSFLNKTHLSGTYLYNYDNINLKFQMTLDTLQYTYTLKKQ